MAELQKETTTTQDTNNNSIQGNNTDRVVDTQIKKETKGNQNESSDSQKGAYIVYYLFGALEILLAFRFVLKLAGASNTSDFVSFIYSFSGIFVSPFAGIFHTRLSQGSETTSVFEPSTLVAIIVYMLIAWGIVKLIRIFSGEQQAE